MKEADLFRQFAKLAMRWSSSKFTSADEKRTWPAGMHKQP